jgi:hypothetical protein
LMWRDENMVRIDYRSVIPSEVEESLANSGAESRDVSTPVDITKKFIALSAPQ